MLKKFPNILLRDLNPEGIVTNEDLVGLRQVQMWFDEKDEKLKKIEEARSRTKANKHNRQQ